MAKATDLLKRFICNPKIRFEYLSQMGLLNHMSDEMYLKKKYKLFMGKELNLNHPRTLNEKLQWLKLYDRRAEYTMMVDKYRVRRYIAEKLGEEYLIPLIAVWQNPDEIDFKALPKQFVLKCNHNSGKGLCICRNKDELDVEAVRAALHKGINENYYLHGREWPYKDVPRKTICEKFMENKGKRQGLMDYKFYCFHGKPEYLYVSENLEKHTDARISFLNLDWSFADFGRSDFKPLKILPPKPVNFSKMLLFAEKLSNGIPFLRVDFYEVEQKLYFGELTFFPCSGFMPFKPEEADQRTGEMLKLEKVKKYSGGGVLSYSLCYYFLETGGISMIEGCKNYLQYLWGKILPQSKYQDYLRKKGVKIGNNCKIFKSANFGSEPYLVSLGNHVRVNIGVQFVTHDGGYWVLRDEISGYGEQFKDADYFGKIEVGDNVHIGTNAILMPGIKIGKNVVVACGAVVTHDVRDNTIVGGIPAVCIETLETYAAKARKKYVNTKHMTRKEKEIYLRERME